MPIDWHTLSDDWVTLAFCHPLHLYWLHYLTKMNCRTPFSPRYRSVLDHLIPSVSFLSSVCFFCFFFRIALKLLIYCSILILKKHFFFASNYINSQNSMDSQCVNFTIHIFKLCVNLRTHKLTNVVVVVVIVFCLFKLFLAVHWNYNGQSNCKYKRMCVLLLFYSSSLF